MYIQTNKFYSRNTLKYTNTNNEIKADFFKSLIKEKSRNGSHTVEFYKKMKNN